MQSNIGIRSILVNWAQLQKDIFSDGLKMPAPGDNWSYLTRAIFWENEGVKDFVENNPGFKLVAIPKLNGMKVMELIFQKQLEMYPHHFKGEGQFGSKIQDKRVSGANTYQRGNSKQGAEATLEDFLQNTLKLDWMVCCKFLGHLPSFQKGYRDLLKLKCS